MGGFAAIKKTAEYTYIKNVAAFASFNFGYVGKLFDIIPGAKEMALEKLSVGSMLLNTTGEELLKDIINHYPDWDLVDIAPKMKDKNLLLIGAMHDHLAPGNMHHQPLAVAFRKNKNIAFSEHLLDTGHSFSDKRIRLTSLLIEWLNKITF